MDQEPQTTDSLFDYLYIDTRRIKHWLAQLDDNGVLSSFKRSSSDSSENNAGLTGGGSWFPGKVDGSIKDAFSEGIEHSYDSEWSRPRLVLDFLDQSKFISRDIKKAGLGQLVLFSGQMQVYDINLIRGCWDTMSEMAKHESLPEAVGKNANQERKQFSRNMRNLGELLRAVPGDTQIYIRNDDGILAWSILDESFFQGNPTSLSLSNGYSMGGEWCVVGILDGLPSDNTEPEPPFATLDFSGVMSSMMDLARQQLGRDPAAYSISPLMVFRGVPCKPEGQEL